MPIMNRYRSLESILPLQNRRTKALVDKYRSNYIPMSSILARAKSHSNFESMNLKQDKEPKRFSNVEMKYLHHMHKNEQDRSSINLR